MDYNAVLLRMERQQAETNRYLMQILDELRYARRREMERPPT